MSKNIAVIGLGSSGILSLSHLLYFLPDDFTVTSISDPNTPILGIGESTNPSFIAALERGADLRVHEEVIEGSMKATVKYGTQMINWREHTFVNPLIGGTLALHIDTFELKKFALPRFRSKWKSKFKEIHGNVNFVTDLGDKVVVGIDGIDHYYDYVMDCRGGIKAYDDYTVVENPTNHCLVHNVMEGSNTGFTGHTATKDGWMFTVPLQHRTSYGYLFNNLITDVDTAKENFSKEIGVPIDQLDTTEYKFTSYYANTIFKNRIALNGNRAVFFEPMFANSLYMYEGINRLFFDIIMRDDVDMFEYNKLVIEGAQNVQLMIAFFYHGGSTYSTPFWGNAVTNSTDLLIKSSKIKDTSDRYKTFYTSGKTLPPAWVFDTTGLEIVDREFGYNYLKREIS